MIGEERTVTVTGTVRREFRRDYGNTNLSYMDTERHGKNRIEIKINSGCGWGRFYMTNEEVRDLIVTLEEQLHEVQEMKREC
jgi:hypothetical protein